AETEEVLRALTSGEGSSKRSEAAGGQGPPVTNHAGAALRVVGRSPARRRRARAFARRGQRFAERSRGGPRPPCNPIPRRAPAFSPRADFSPSRRPTRPAR